MGLTPVTPPISGFAPLESVAVTQPKKTGAVSSIPTTTVLNPSKQAAAMHSKLDPPTLKSANIQRNQQKTDTLDLSPRAKAKMLSNNGRAIWEIAIILNLDVKTIASYLGA